MRTLRILRANFANSENFQRRSCKLRRLVALRQVIALSCKFCKDWIPMHRYIPAITHRQRTTQGLHRHDDRRPFRYDAAAGHRVISDTVGGIHHFGLQFAPPATSKHTVLSMAPHHPPPSSYPSYQPSLLTRSLTSALSSLLNHWLVVEAIGPSVDSTYEYHRNQHSCCICLCVYVFMGYR